VGLDVYLYKCSDRELAESVEQMYEAESKKIWGSKNWEEYTQEEKDSNGVKAKELAESLGLDKYGGHPARVQIELPSKLHPEHMFKIGYFRSSYNSGGYNSVMNRAGLQSLYQIFDTGDDKYEIVPDWDAVLPIATEAVERARAYAASDKSKYDVMTLGTMFLEPNVANAEEALQVFFKELERHGGDNLSADFSSYSNSNGMFHLNGLKIYAAIHGKEYSHPATYIVYGSEGGFRWYLEATEIVKETVEYVLAQPDKGDYYMHWSG